MTDCRKLLYQPLKLCNPPLVCQKKNAYFFSSPVALAVR